MEPTSFESYLALGNVYRSPREFAHAVGAFETALGLNPDVASVQESYGQALVELGKGERARAAFARALELDPERASVHYTLGESLLVDGEIDSALESFKRCLHCDPTYGHAWERLADAAKFLPLAPELLEDLENRVNDTHLSDNQRISLWFAFGTLLDSQALGDRAFGYFQRANTLARRRFKYDKSTHEARVDRTIEVFDGKRIAKGFAGANPSDTPVFIVGMARSGTSLLEQIIASHPQAHGDGELDFFPNFGYRFDDQYMFILINQGAILIRIFKEGSKKFGQRAWSSMIVKRLEDYCKTDLRVDGYPNELKDKEPETKGMEL